MFKNVTMINISHSTNLEWKSLSLMIGNSESSNCNHLWFSFNNIHKKSLVSCWGLKFTCSERSRVYFCWSSCIATGRHCSINSLELCLISLEIEVETMDHLEIGQVNMNGMVICHHIHNVKIIGFPLSK